MFNASDIIKFSDYKDINYVTNDCFSYVSKGKNINIKGPNVEKYIYPIFNKLFQPNYISDLVNDICNKNKAKKEDLKIFETEFIRIIFKLYKLGIIELLEKEIIFRQNNKSIHNYKTVKSEKLTIINFFDYEYLKPLLLEFTKMPFNIISIINICPDITDTVDEKSLRSDIANYSVVYKKYSDLKSLPEIISDSSFLVTLHSAKNIEINSIINKYVIDNNIPWLNCIANDIDIEIGPLVFSKKTACYECYKYLYEKQQKKYKEYNNSFVIRAYKVSRKSNLYIALGYVIDEILKFIDHENLLLTPLTVNNIITFSGLDLTYNIKPVLKIPNCKICSQSK